MVYNELTTPRYHCDYLALPHDRWLAPCARRVSARPTRLRHGDDRLR